MALLFLCAVRGTLALNNKKKTWKFTLVHSFIGYNFTFYNNIAPKL